MTANFKTALLRFSGLAVLAWLTLAWGPGIRYVSFAYHTGEQSYILLVPVITAGLIYRDRARIFARISSGFSSGVVVLMVVAVCLGAFSYRLPAGSEPQMVVTAASLMTFWVGAFVLCFGATALREAMFPLGMLLWMIPLPRFCVALITAALQKASAELVEVLFLVTGVPVLRNGYFFQLPGQAIEVAKECSGIRSSLSLVILTLIIAHELLCRNWRRVLLVVSTFPIVVLKNGIRIVTLTLLSIYVDPSFLAGRLHHEGGIVFFLIGILMLVPILALLRWGESTPAVASVADMAEAGRS